MGVCHEVVCDVCKVKRDIDKIRLKECGTHEEACTYCDELESSTGLYKEALLLSFISKHQYCGGIRIINDHTDYDEKEAFDYKDDGVFW